MLTMPSLLRTPTIMTVLTFEIPAECDTRGTKHALAYGIASKTDARVQVGNGEIVVFVGNNLIVQRDVYALASHMGLILKEMSNGQQPNSTSPFSDPSPLSPQVRESHLVGLDEPRHPVSQNQAPLDPGHHHPGCSRLSDIRSHEHPSAST